MLTTSALRCELFSEELEPSSNAFLPERADPSAQQKQTPVQARAAHDQKNEDREACWTRWWPVCGISGYVVVGEKMGKRLKGRGAGGGSGGCRGRLSVGGSGTWVKN